MHDATGLEYDEQDPQLVTLLDDALGPHGAEVPGDLAERIVAMTVLERRLDAALGAAAVPQRDALARRIVERTTGAARGMGVDRDLRSGVLARLGPVWLRRCRYAAAIVIFAAEVGITMAMMTIVSDARGFWQMREELRRMAHYTGPQAPIDSQIDQLAVRLEDSQPAEEWGTLRDAMNDLVTDLEGMAAREEEG